MELQTDKPSEAGTKKCAYDEFSREDLVKKCKHLLIIAQKSKQAKTEISKENAELKKQIEEIQAQSITRESELSTLQEVVESLTEQKLKFAIELEAHTKANSTLKSQIEVLNEEQEEIVNGLTSKNDLLHQRISELNGKLEELEIESISLKRQNARLTDENENLLKQLEDLESQTGRLNELGEAQRTDLLKLEANASIDQSAEHKKSSAEFIENSEEIKNLENSLASVTLKVNELNDLVKLKDEQLTSLTDTIELKEKLYSTEKDNKEKLHLRLKSYREKIVKCASSITQLKNSNLVLLKTVSEYSKSIPNWQNDILNASKLLSEQLLALESENIKLKENLQVITENKPDEIEKTVLEFNKLNAKYIQLESEAARERQSLSEQLMNLEFANDTILNKVKELESEKITLINEGKHLREINNSMEESLNLKEHELVRFSEVTYELKRIIERLENEKGSLNQDIEILKADKSAEEVSTSLGKELSKSKDAYRVLENEYKSLTDTNELLRDEVNMLKISLEAPTQEVGSLSELNASLQADLSKLETKLSAYKQENSSLLSEIKELGQKLASAESILKESEEEKLRYSNYKIENAELLNEMKEVNQVLKERGEIISKQEKAISESERVLQLLEKEVKSLKESLVITEDANSHMSNELELYKRSVDDLKKEKEEINNQILFLKNEKDSVYVMMEQKEDLIAFLKDEIDRWKQNTSFNDVQSEVMSASTISKMEESSRLKELDDSFEERYNKLKAFAVKLKKKVDTLQVSLQQSEDEKTSLQNTLEEIKKRSNELSETNCTKLPASEEGNKSDSNIIYEKEHQHLQHEHENALKKVGKLEGDLKLLVNEKVQLEMELGELKRSRQDTAGDKIKGGEVTKLKADLDLRNTELSTLRDQLEKARKDAKKNSVLSLEMADYERSMKEQGIKLEERKRKMTQMESTIDTHQATIVSLKTQVKLLEDQIKSNESQAREIKENLNRSAATVEERDSVIIGKIDQISVLERQIENLKSMNEELNMQLTGALGEKEIAIIALSNEKTELLQRAKKLDARFAELEEKYHLKNIEYSSLVAEFNNYKMRAQSVLRQNQVKDHSQEETLQNENVSLKSEVEGLKTKYEALKEEYSNVSTNLSVERRRSTESNAAAVKLRQLSDQLSAELQVVKHDLQEERARFNVQISTLTHCYKKQISELEEKLQTDTANLKKEISILEMKNATKGGNGVHVVTTSDGGSDSLDAEINVTMLQREEGEGSESSPPPFITSGQTATMMGSSVIDGNAKSGRRSPLPLERLLEEGVPDDLIGGENEMQFVDMTPEQQLIEVKKRLEAQEQRVQHVSLLLSESERESARLGEMCTVLKAEVRRLTRALDRHTHAHNPEYLKNVLFKFLTLSAGDERVRLVPVLNTILTLSPEETHKLDAVAKGVDLNSNRGWGSYLPWPGPR